VALGPPSSQEGELGKTPMAHLLVYAVERQLTGVLCVGEVGREPTRIRLARGVPVKIKVGDGFAMFGEMLIEARAIDRKTLDEALATQGLLGDVLMLAGRVEKRVLERVAAEQFVRRIVHLFELGPTARFRYEEGSAELLEWGGEPANVDPLFLLWKGVSAHGSSSLRSTIAALGAADLSLHALTPSSRYALSDDERLLVEHLAACPSSIDELASFELLPREHVERLVYFLAIVRALDLGNGATPLGVESIPKSGRSLSQIVAKVALRPMTHRQGAAAPDLPGDGERGPTSVGRQRSKSGRHVPVPAAMSGVPASELMQIACESTPISTPEELIPTQVVPPTGRSRVDSRSEPSLPPLNVGPPSQSVSNAATLLSPKHADLPPAVTPTSEALCALARERMAKNDLAGALDAIERAVRRRPIDPSAQALAEHLRSVTRRRV
jgi:hypothetical protein